MKKKIYPIVLQFYLIACIIFDIYLFFYVDVKLKVYAGIMFLVLVNSLTNSISSFNIGDYNDVFCILDMLEYASFALMLLSIKNSKFSWFWLSSCFVQALYIPWNAFYIKTTPLSPYAIRKIKQYSALDGISAMVSLIVYIICLLNDVNNWYLMIGFVSWLIVLGMWAVDFFSFDSKIDLPGSKIMLYDVSSGVWKYVKSISVDEHGIINSVKFGNSMAEPDEGTEYYMLPGLVDTHVHVDQNPYATGDVETLALIDIVKNNALEAVESGITTICDMGGNQLNNYYAIKKLMHNDNLIARIETTGCFFSRKYGHYMQHGGFAIENPQDASLYANYLTKLGIKYAKVMLGNYEFTIENLEEVINAGGYTDKRINNVICSFYPNFEGFDRKDEKTIDDCLEKINSFKVYTLDELKLIIKEFRQRNIDVFAHAFLEEDVDVAIDAGVTRIEHPGKYSDKLIKRMAANGVIVTSSFVAAEDGAVLSSTLPGISAACSVNLMERWYYDTRDILPKLYENDIKVALGTDSGFLGTPCCSLVREIISLVDDLKIPVRKVLKSATLVAAEKLNMQNTHRIGEIAPKAYADFVLYEANFINDVNALLNPAQVWVRGEKVYERKYD